MSVFWIATIASILLFLLYWMSKKPGSQLRHLPHLVGWPVLGNLLQVNLERPHLTFTEWSKTLGGVFSVQLFQTSFVVLNSYDAIYEVLVTKGDRFAGRPQSGNFRVEYFSHGFEDVTFTNPHLRWKTMRKVSQRQIKAFDSGMKRLEELNLSVIEVLVRNFRGHGGESFNPREYIYHAVVNIMTTLLVNRTYHITDKIFKTIKEIETLAVSSLASSGYGVELDIFPWLRHFGNSTFKKLQRQRMLSHELWITMKENILDDLAREVCDHKKDGVFHELMRLCQHQERDESHSAATVKEMNLEVFLSEMLIAGATTSTSSFYAFLGILVNHPEVQQKLTEEVDNVVGPNRKVSLEDRQKMPYTQATILELLRYTCVAPLSLPHAAMTDSSVCGFSIPKGTQLLLNIWALHHQEDFWDEPHKFKPDRFLEADGQLVTASHQNRKHLMPFSAGPRVCLGELIAMGRLFLLVATIAQVFHLEPGSGGVPWDSREYQSSIALQPEDYEIQVKSRNECLFV